jgi:hypothetical protein
VAGSWKTISVPDTSTGAFNADIMLLLTDGSVLVHNGYTSVLANARQWLRLWPDSNGNYETGTWSGELDMQYARQFFASGVMSDGRVFVIGGEYSNDPAAGPAGQNDAWSGEIYDPRAGTWTLIDKPDAFNFVRGDCNGSVLADGRVLLGGASVTEPPSTWSTLTAIWNPNADPNNPNDKPWVQAGLGGMPKEDPFEEETFCLLPDGSVLAPAVRDTPKAQRYLPSLDQWVNCMDSPVQLAITSIKSVKVEDETGPIILLPSGAAFAIGGTGLTALYTPPPGFDPTGQGSWTQGPTFPEDTSASPNWQTLTALDAPACLLPSGKVVCMGGTTALEDGGYVSKNPVLLEYDPASPATALPELDAQPDLPAGNSTWQSFMLLLPTGQILLSAQARRLFLYTPDPATSAPQAAWRPTIASCPGDLVGLAHSYTLSGTQLNGLSQAVSYGDDAGMATNYPLVQLTNANGDVSYLPTSNFSTMAVAAATDTVSADFLATGVPSGPWQLRVIANGIASDPLSVEVTSWGPSSQYDTGGPNAVALDGLGNAVEVHVDSGRLYYRVGTVDATNRTITWGEGHQYDTGGPNAVALDDHGNVVEVHVGTGRLFYRVGTVDFTSQTIALGRSFQYDTGGPNAVALDDLGNVVEVHVGTRRLFYRVARI